MRVNKIFSTTILTLSSIVGVGFLSGKEILVFFLSGNLLIASVACSFLIFVGVYYLLAQDCFWTFPLSFLTSPLAFLSNFISLAGMFAALESLFSSYFSFGTTFPFFSVLFAAVSLVFLKKGLSALSKINFFLLAAAVFFTIASVFFVGGFTYVPSNKITPFSYFAYVGLNLFSSTPLYEKIRRQLSKREAFFTALSTAVVFCFLSLLIGLSLSGEGRISSLHMPLLAKLSSFVFLKPLILTSTFFVMLSSIFIKSYSVQSFVVEITKGKTRIASLLALSVFSLALSRFGFNNIVSYLYPVIGIAGGLSITFSAIFRLASRARQHRDTLPPQASTK